MRRKLTKEEALAIFNSDKSYAELALEFNARRHTIGQIKTGKNWPEITGKKYEIKYKHRTDPNKECVTCGKVFKAKGDKTKFCSQKCCFDNFKSRDLYRTVVMPKKLLPKECIGCHKIFIPRRSSLLYCNQKCWAENVVPTDKQRNCMTSEQRRNLILKTQPHKFVKKENYGKGNIGKIRSESVRKKISDNTKKSWENGIFDNDVNVRRKNLKRGKEHFNYKNGAGTIRINLYSLFEYKQWRTSVFKRDDYTCQRCKKRGGTLEAHHKTPFREIHKKYGFETHIEAAKCEELFDVNNGVTLCRECHSIVDKHRKIKKHDGPVG